MFYSPTEFVFGKDTELQTGTLVKKFHGTNVLIVYGKSSVRKNGLLNRVKKIVRRNRHCLHRTSRCAT